MIIVDEEPQFPGGPRALDAYIKREMRYPDRAEQLLVQGAVLLSFDVGTDGCVSNVKVVRGIGEDCDEEAIRIVQGMPQWRAGRKQGQLVSSPCNVSIEFKLRPSTR